MMFHASMPAKEPAHVARVIAELWQGEAYPFPPFPGAYIAFAWDERGTEMEVVPYTQENIIGEAEVITQDNAAASGLSPCHMAIATPLTADQVLAIGKREDWRARICDRGGCFHVIELWVENRFLLEVLTDKMQAEYLSFMTPQNWRRTFAVSPV